MRGPKDKGGALQVCRIKRTTKKKGSLSPEGMGADGCVFRDLEERTQKKGMGKIVRCVNLH